jgi:hypothetical protein
LTHFGAIFRQGEDDHALELISIIGCWVSIISIGGIFLTFAVDRQLMKGAGQKILLLKAANLVLLPIIFLAGASVKKSQLGCICFGFLLHYAILSNFIWKGIAGYLQYRRLVMVIKTRSAKLLTKLILVGWLAPLIPGLLAVFFNQSDIYSGEPLCLPNGVVFAVVILAPLCIVLAVNTGIFVKIALSLYKSSIPRRHANYSLALTRFKQLLFLYVLLGLNWAFGVCQMMFPSNIAVPFAYLFCITISFHGLSFFVFVIGMNKRARDAWNTFLSSEAINCCKKQPLLASGASAETSI